MEPQFGNVNGPIFQSFNVPMDMGFRMGESDSNSDLSWAQPAVTNQMPSFGSLTLPQTDPFAGYGILSSSSRQKPRGRFDDVRRKEVSKIRKQGACLRCRMLKKPCSEGTPCKTCASVESARIWRGVCLRTRLSDEMTLWSMKAFQTRAEAKVATATESLGGGGVSCRLGVSFLESPEYVNVPVKGVGALDLERSRASDRQGAAVDQQASVWVLDTDENTGQELGAYAIRTMCSSIEAQPALMKDILRRTQDLSAAMSSVRATEASTDLQQGKKTHPSHFPQNELLKNVLELWALTEILTSKDPVQLRTSASEVPESPDYAAVPSTDIPPTSISRAVLEAQLLAVMEARCSKLSKSALNELERRLLQRQQTSRFATLLSAFVLLSSVERMTGYYRSCELSLSEDVPLQDETAVPGASSTADLGPTAKSVNTLDKTDTAATLCLSDTSPSALWPQGEHFSGLLISLLRMRALPPKTKVTLEGTLESIRDFAMPVPQVNGQPAKKPEEDHKEAAADWLDALKLQADPLKEKRDAEVPAPGDGLDAWSLRYVAKVLLPERGR